MKDLKVQENSSLVSLLEYKKGKLLVTISSVLIEKVIEDLIKNSIENLIENLKFEIDKPVP